MGVTDWIIQLVSTLGYIGIIIAMIIESASVPLPSEVIMGIAGFLVFKGELNIFLVGLAGAFGNVIGSTIMYVIGTQGGKPLVKKHGHRLHIDEERFLKVSNWFYKYGDKVIFFSQLLPVVRTFVSLPAGILNKSYTKFCLYTFVGAFLWCFLLAFISSSLGEAWITLLELMHRVELGLLVLLAVAVFGYVFYRLYKFRLR